MLLAGDSLIICRSLRPLIVALIPGQQRSLDKLKDMRLRLSNEVAALINEFGPKIYDDFDEVRFLTRQFLHSIESLAVPYSRPFGYCSSLIWNSWHMATEKCNGCGRCSRQSAHTPNGETSCTNLARASLITFRHGSMSDFLAGVGVLIVVPAHGVALRLSMILVVVELPTRPMTKKRPIMITSLGISQIKSSQVVPAYQNLGAGTVHMRIYKDFV